MKNLNKYFKSVGGLFIVSLITTITYAQIIPAIPTAQQQPKWFFPIFVEDATGAKDTVYYGYDPTATGIDTVFGEYSYPMDSGAFKPYVGQLFNDTYLDVDISDSVYFVGSAFYLFLDNTVFPIKIWWDDITRLRSDSLPFPDPPIGAPRGQIVLDIGSTSAYLTNPGKNAWGGQIIISDTAQTGSDSQTIEDTIFLADIFNNPFPQSVVIYVYFRKWTGMPINDITEMNRNEIKIYPNPVSDFLFMSELPSDSYYLIYDLTGRIKSSNKLNSNMIDVGFLNQGLYLLKINSLDGTIVLKFFKK